MAVFRGCITLNDDSDMILVIETNAPQYGFATRIMRLLSRLQPTRTLDLQVRFNWNDEPPLEGKEQRLDRWEHIKSHLSGVCNLDTNKEIALFVGLGVCQEVTLRTDEERVSILRIGCQQVRFSGRAFPLANAAEGAVFLFFILFLNSRLDICTHNIQTSSLMNFHLIWHWECAMQSMLPVRF